MIKLEKNKKYLLACSYGPDSMALFGMLLIDKYQFIVAHVNYGLREEAKFETDELTSFCESFGIKLYKKYVNGNAFKGNIESKCRDVRYRFFSEVFECENCDELLVAHHLNDHIETYLLQKQRRSFVTHYGLAEKRHLYSMDVRRPLLHLTKDELLDYCYSKNIPFAIDKTNLENKFQRNKIRHEIVEKMSKEEMLKICEEISKKNAKIRELDTFLENLDLNSVEVMVNLDDKTFLSALHKDLAFFLDENNKKINISLSRAKEIKKALLSPKSNITIDLGKSIKYTKAYDRCYYTINKESEPYSYVLERPSKLDTPYFYLDFSKGASNRNVTESDYPITIRTARANDTFKIRDYSVKVRRAFIDWKMPLELRRKWPVIVNKNGEVIYVPRYKPNFFPNSSTNFFVKTNE